MALGEPLDVVAYVRTLEEALIRCCADVGVTTTRVAGRSGVWITGDGRPDRKVGAIGIRVSRGVTMHGFAVNCDCDLAWFDNIVPCGIRDAGVTSLSLEAGRPVTVAELTGLAEHHLAGVFGAQAWRRASLASLLPDAELSPAAP
jgi:lipoyl(octanoyl) transferase